MDKLRNCILSARFKLIMGHLQIDNQLPLTLMPVLLAPEQMSDIHHPVCKMTITMQNANTDGIQVYPYVYIRVMLYDYVWLYRILLDNSVIDVQYLFSHDR